MGAGGIDAFASEEGEDSVSFFSIPKGSPFFISVFGVQGGSADWCRIGASTRVREGIWRR